MSWKRCSGLALAIVFLGLSAILAASPQLRIEMQVEREVLEENSSGERTVRREPVEAAEAGDVLVYTLRIANEGPAPALKAKVLDPIPRGTVLIAGSASGDGTRITYSIDGAESFATYPITRTAVRDDGTRTEVPVGMDEYTHVRWTLMEPLAPGQTRIAQFKVRVQ